jgi:hypothetical protein
LRNEPGFNRLPQQQQQHLIDRLHQLDSMPVALRTWSGSARTAVRLCATPHRS